MSQKDVSGEDISGSLTDISGSIVSESIVSESSVDASGSSDVETVSDISGAQTTVDSALHTFRKRVEERCTVS